MTSPRLEAAAASTRTEAEVRAQREPNPPAPLAPLTWRAPSYPGDRHLALAGTISVGAVFPPIGGKYWRWRSWIGTTTNPAEGSEKSEALAKAAVAARYTAFLDGAGLGQFVRFADQVARMLLDGEELEGRAYEQTDEDAQETLANLIHQARAMTGIEGPGKPVCSNFLSDGRGCCRNCNHFHGPDGAA